MFAALAASCWIKDQAGWPIRRLARTARRYRTLEIQAGPHTITAASPLPARRDVNLGNVTPAGVLSLQTLRPGLRSDTVPAAALT